MNIRSDRNEKEPRVLELVRGGLGIKEAAEAAGVPYSTAAAWCAKAGVASPLKRRGMSPEERRAYMKAYHKAYYESHREKIAAQHRARRRLRRGAFACPKPKRLRARIPKESKDGEVGESRRKYLLRLLRAALPEAIRVARERQREREAYEWAQLHS